ncbi:MAG: hypothetical protein E5Y04_28660 [Mesorhizobium sp.]|nr:MAG: hypothetical protein E5Y04_28660 [Mesorhizobium sp.]
MPADQTVTLDVSRAGRHMIFKVTVFDPGSGETTVSGWIVAKNLDRTDAALEEAQAFASAWCRERGIETYDLWDHRVYSNPSQMF